MSSLSAHEKKEMKLAVMLMIVVVVFLICNILALITNILEVFFGEEGLEVLQLGKCCGRSKQEWEQTSSWSLRRLNHANKQQCHFFQIGSVVSEPAPLTEK